VSSVAVMVYAVRDDRGRRLPAVHSIELVVRNFAESPPIFVKIFLHEASNRKYFRFPQVFIKILS